MSTFSTKLPCAILNITYIPYNILHMESFLTNRPKYVQNNTLKSSDSDKMCLIGRS